MKTGTKIKKSRATKLYPALTFISITFAIQKRSAKPTNSVALSSKCATHIVQKNIQMQIPNMKYILTVLLYFLNL